ncbi:MAG: hypothetical protein ACRDNY_10245 [Gaiellaceae bacterium]
MASLREWPAGAIRAGVVLSVVALAASGFTRLDETLGLFDYRADRNAGLAYLDREYGDRGWAPDRRVIEDARLWMPPDATYRIALGRKWDNLDGTVAADFLRYFLMPRMDTESVSAPWVFCYGCDLSGQDGFEVLSEGRDGIRFGRMRG